MAPLSSVGLTVLMGPVAVRPAPADVVAAIDGATVTQAVGSRSGFQLSLTYSRTSTIGQTLLPTGFFDPMVRVVLVAVLRGVPTVLADGPIKRQDVTATGRPGENRLVLTGEDVSGYMDAVDLTGFPFPGMPAFARVALMMAKYAPLGVVPATVPAPFQGVESPIAKIAQQTGTDFAYATQLAKDAGYEFYIRPGPLPGANVAYWGPQVRVGPSQPAISIDLGSAATADTVTFAADGNASVLPFGHVKIAGFSVPVPLPPVGLGPPLAARPLVPTNTKLLGTEALTMPEVLSALFAARTSTDPVTASGTMDLTRYGTPLSARSLVGVRGAGPAHDGVWFVRSITHTLGRGSWKQAFQLARDGLVSTVPEVLP
ncbi:hypothetical protein PHK61_28775 [Actinomycetospora lutea]|uniref:hypothetical protein n=1 Tax=Actinomycetospora lutea TaxID=663604 RepID=UPI0023659F09|nr:hypothetical protein [Actinomycetospora lutea]MDD7942416.1 hypothetical protein [Actinomycetospora lutea]